LMERAPHFHLWLVPKKNEGELRGVAYLAQQPPLTTSYSEAQAMSRKIREQFERSWRRPGPDYAILGLSALEVSPPRRHGASDQPGAGGIVGRRTPAESPLAAGVWVR
jgi:hypothetical protein